MASQPKEHRADNKSDDGADSHVSSRWRSPALLIAAGYAAVAVAWILFSDHAIGLFAPTLEHVVNLGIYKGIGFVLATAAFLWLIVRKTYGALEESNARLVRQKEELRRLGRVNSALSHINQAIVRFSNREELFQRVCDVLVTDGGLQLTWIGWHDPTEKRLNPVAAAGEGREFVLTMVVYSDERPEGMGPSGLAFRSGEPVVFNDMLDPAVNLPLGWEIYRKGVRAAAALPIREGGRIVGVLAVYSRERGFFQEGEIELLREAAGDIGFALDSMAREANRRRAEEAAAAERNFSATMIDSMPGVLYFYDQNLKFLRWNKNFEEVTGYTAEEVSRMSPLDFFAPDDHAHVHARIAEVFEKGDTAVEALFRTKDGRALPYFFTGRRVMFEGRPCLIGAGIDISERIRAEEALRESEERFRATFEQAAVGIAHVSPDGHFRWVNDQLCVIAGWSREELLGMHFTELTASEDLAESVASVEALLSDERDEFTADKRYRRKDGQEVWVSVVVKIIRDTEARPKYFVVVVADISERRRLEQQFLRAQRLESVGALAGGLAHDLNNLLAPVMMGIELLRLSRLPPSTTSTLDGMERSTRRAAGLVRQVLSFARGVEVARRPLDLRDVVREVETFVRSSFPHNIVVNCELAHDLWSVMGDATQLNQVLLNFCVNARDALPDGGRLNLRASNVVLEPKRPDVARGETPGRHVMIEVSDNGCGMSAEVQARIFEPFFTTKAPGKGTGLGLSTALGIVRSHGGRVEVESAPGQGATFRIFLPARPEASEGGAPRSESEHPRQGAGELILVVDDESSLLEVTREMLSAFGYRVITASDGVAAIAIFEQRRSEIAAVVADLRMPGMEKPGLADALRAIDPKVRIIGLGALVGGEVPPDTGEQSVFFLPKPYAADTLLAVLRRALATK